MSYVHGNFFDFVSLQYNPYLFIKLVKESYTYNIKMKAAILLFLVKIV